MRSTVVELEHAAPAAFAGVREPRHEVIVLGAGPAGLAAAAALGEQGIDALILEQAQAVGSGWRSRYGPDVVLAGGVRITPDAVTAGTGYARALEPLVGRFGVPGLNGRPHPAGAITHPDAHRLYFVGSAVTSTGMLREAGIDAKRVARAVTRSRRHHSEPA